MQKRIEYENEYYTTYDGCSRADVDYFNSYVIRADRFQFFIYSREWNNKRAENT